MNAKWKTLLFVSPIALLLASCGGSTKQYLIRASFDECEQKGIKAGYKVNEDVSFTVTPHTGYKLPEKDDDVNFTISGIKKESIDYVIDSSGIGNVSFTMPNNDIDFYIKAIQDVPIEKHHVTFDSTTCDSKGIVTEGYEVGDLVEFTVTPKTTTDTLPTSLEDKEHIQLTNLNIKQDNVGYSVVKNVGTFTFNMPAKEVTIAVTAIPPTPPTPSHTFTFNGTNCTADNETSYSEGDPIYITITSTESKFILPLSKSDITVDGFDSEDEYEYYYNDPNEALFTCTMPDNAVTVTVEAVLGLSITTTVGGVTLDPDRILAGNPYNGLIKLKSDDKVLPDTTTGLKSVILDPKGTKTEIKDHCSYERTSDRKVANFSIPAEYVTADIEVDLVLEDAPTMYTFTFNGTNCMAIELSPEYAEGDDVYFEIYPMWAPGEPEYALPATLPDGAVEGVTDYEYKIKENSNVGVFSCTMPANAVTVSVTAELIPSHNVTFVTEHCTATGIGTSYQEGAMVYTEDISPDEGYSFSQDLEGAITVTGIALEDCEYGIDENTGLGWFVCNMPKNDITITITATKA